MIYLSSSYNFYKICYNSVNKMLKGAFHMTYSEKIKKLRVVLLITQQELADLLSVSVVTVNRWENNKFEPTMKEKRKLSVLFEKNNVHGEDK